MNKKDIEHVIHNGNDPLYITLVSLGVGRQYALRIQRALEASMAENERLRKGVDDALDYSGGRFSEWGERAIRVQEILEDTIEDHEFSAENPDANE